MERRKEVGRLDIENPKCKWHKTVYLKDGKLMKTIHDGNFSPDEPDPTMLPLYLEAAQANSTVSMVSTLETAPDLEYSTDGVTWQEWQHTTADGTHTFDAITLGAIGDKVYFRGDNPNGLGYINEDDDVLQTSNFKLTGSIKAGGNVMSLLDTSMALTVVPNAGFASLFAVKPFGATSVLVTTPDMSSVTAIGDYGCMEVYLNCTTLTAAANMPILTSIGGAGCESMYSGCTFDMSDNGTTLNFAFPTPPVMAGETTLSTAYDVAVWMDNTNGFDGAA